MLPEFHTNIGLMGAPTHDLSIGHLQAYRSPAGLQGFLLEQLSPDQAHLGTRIYQNIHHQLLSSAPYKHLQVQLPLVTMRCMDNCHGMQLQHVRVH